MKRIFLTIVLLLLTNIEADVIEKCLKENKIESCYEAGTLYSNENRMKEAFQMYTKACDGGDSNSCANVGLMYAIGKGVEKNTQKAKEILRMACSKDAESMACINLKYVNNHNRGSYVWMHGEKGTLTSDHQPVKVHAKACEKGSARDCIEAGFCYEVGDLAKKDTKKAIEFYKRACELNLSIGCSNTAILYVKNQNFTKSREFFKKACNNNDAKACHSLAVMYDEGQGVVIDKKRAEKLYKKACKKGVGVACYNLGVNYSLGDGVEKNSKKAIKFYTQACDKKNGAGCSNLGLEYTQGTHLKKDEKKGHALYKKACDLNNYMGCVILGESYYMGTGVKKNINNSLKSYSKACNNGVALGCSKLGIIYYYGDGVTIDKKKAKGLISKACNAGDTDACHNLNILKREER